MHAYTKALLLLLLLLLLQLLLLLLFWRRELGVGEAKEEEKTRVIILFSNTSWQVEVPFYGLNSTLSCNYFLIFKSTL